MEYEVKWKGWKTEMNTWEHELDLSNCSELIEQYWTEKVNADEDQDDDSDLETGE